MAQGQPMKLVMGDLEGLLDCRESGNALPVETGPLHAGQDTGRS